MFVDGLKTAALKLMKPPVTKIKTRHMASSVPRRVTTDLQPLNAVNGIGGITGSKELDAPFSRSGFGKPHKLGLGTSRTVGLK